MKVRFISFQDEQNFKRIADVKWLNYKVIACYINNEKYEGDYAKTIRYLYKLVADHERYKSITCLNIDKCKREETSGWKYHKDIDLYIQGFDSNHAVTEIVGQCYNNEFNLMMNLVYYEKTSDGRRVPCMKTLKTITVLNKSIRMYD